jgi:hypothetical protein
MYIDVYSSLMRLRIAVRAAAAAFTCLILFYLVPTLIEIALAAIVGPAVAGVIWGDAVGCTFIAVWHRKAGIGLYLALACAEVVFLRTGFIRPSTLPWLTDLVPAAVLAVVAATLTAGAGLVVRRNEDGFVSRYS